MLRNSEVPTVMLRVEATLARAARTRNAPSVLVVPPEGDAELGIARLRRAAQITAEVPSGSARPVIGPAIRFAKRVVRRLLRWYVTPVTEQQTRFNHASLDLVERLRTRNEKLETEVELLRARVDKLAELLEASRPARLLDGEERRG
jgi:hypothetical protein